MSVVEFPRTPQMATNRPEARALERAIVDAMSAYFYYLLHAGAIIEKLENDGPRFVAKELVASIDFFEPGCTGTVELVPLGPEGDGQ